ncbi:MAG: hypothetical protein DWP97_08475 [Calditrichaeota bacterium]|nr:MAG: hypothetical protein DWP97_08475 [Calditrichota bacterium]
MDKYTPRERIGMICAGEKPDRFAASFWRHFFHLENNAEGTAEAMLRFQKKFNWDFMKVNPRADFHIEDYGFKHTFSTDEFKKHDKTHFPIKKLSDWEKLPEVTPQSKALEEHLRCVSIIRKKSDSALPVLMTLFNPLGIAGRMIEDKQLLVEWMREHPDVIHGVLEKITVTFEKYAEELRNAGSDGLFYATLQWASGDMITWDEYKEFGVPYDLRILKASGSDSLNLLHVCASNNYLRELIKCDYPVSMYNWEPDDPTNVPLDIGVDLISDKAIVGGVDMTGWLLQGYPDEIGYKIDEIKEKFDSSRVIIGPGCAIPPEVKYENLEIIRKKL